VIVYVLFEAPDAAANRYGSNVTRVLGAGAAGCHNQCSSVLLLLLLSSGRALWLALLMQVVGCTDQYQSVQWTLQCINMRPGSCSVLLLLLLLLCLLLLSSSALNSSQVVAAPGAVPAIALSITNRFRWHVSRCC
jgi:hypothetical protein